MVQKKIEGERLKTPIDLSFPLNDTEKEDYVVDVVLKYLHAAKSPIILVDACAIRHRALEEVHKLIEKSGLPVFVAPMGKGAGTLLLELVSSVWRAKFGHTPSSSLNTSY